MERVRRVWRSQDVDESKQQFMCVVTCHKLCLHHRRIEQNLNITIKKVEWKHLKFEKPVKYR